VSGPSAAYENDARDLGPKRTLLDRLLQPPQDHRDLVLRHGPALEPSEAQGRLAVRGLDDGDGAIGADRSPRSGGSFSRIDSARPFLRQGDLQLAQALEDGQERVRDLTRTSSGADPGVRGRAGPAWSAARAGSSAGAAVSVVSGVDLSGRAGRIGLAHGARIAPRGGLLMDGWPRYDLYVITDPALSRGRSHAEVARAALEGGADAIQIRDKSLTAYNLSCVTAEIQPIARKFGARPFSSMTGWTWRWCPGANGRAPFGPGRSGRRARPDASLPTAAPHRGLAPRRGRRPGARR